MIIQCGLQWTQKPLEKKGLIQKLLLDYRHFGRFFGPQILTLVMVKRELIVKRFGA